jgi:hypothetical protein
MPKLNVHQQGLKYQPKVSNNSGKMNSQNFVFDDTSFTKGFTDLLKGTPKTVTLKNLPILPLLLSGVNMNVGDTFNAITAQNVSAILDPKFAIHNAHLYEFEKDIDDIISDYDALGLKLIANESGVLTFMDPNNITDIRFVTGKGIDNKDLEFTFTVTSSVSNLESNTATFSILPWENVNTKTNYVHIGTGGEGTVDNPVIGFTITGDTTKTAKITLNDGTELTATFTDNDTADVTVTDTNANPTRHEIGKVNGFGLKETVTSLVQPTLTGTVITWKFLNENNVVQEIALDIADAIPNQTVDINVDKVEWDVNDTNILKLIETDGTEHDIDLNKYNISAVTNENGSVTVSQNGAEVFTVSHVGISNDYNDLFNKPLISGEHPNGLKGQLYFIDQNGTNKVKPDYLLKRGIIVQTQREFDVVSTKGFSLKEVFSTWDMFSHYGSDLGGGVSPPTFPVFTPDDPQPSTRLEAQEYYDRTLWQYDETNDRIYLTRNVHPYTGFISPREYGNFNFEATFSSPNSDDDQMALVIGFWVDPETGYEHTLSVIRQLTPYSGQGNIVYSVWLNYGQTTAELIYDGTSLAPYPTGTPGGWSVNSPTRVKVIRSGNVYTIKCSQFGTETIDDSTLISLDTDADARLEPFKTATKVAFAAKSQVDARFSNIVFDGLVDYIFWDKGTHYDTYEYNPVGQVFFLQNPKTTFAREYFGYCKFVESYFFDKLYYITEKDDIICFKGDNRVSWDANNALTMGSDNRHFLSKSLVGADQNKITRFNSGWDKDLDYNVSADWIFNGNSYSKTTPITLSPGDPNNPRIDVIAVDVYGDIIVLEGTPSASPIKPQIDPLTQMEGTFINVAAGATSPTGASSSSVYDENLQEAGGEWDASTSAPGRVNLSSTATVKNGSKAIEATDLERFDRIEFINSVPVLVENIEQFTYSINFKPGIYDPDPIVVLVYGDRKDGSQFANYMWFNSEQHGLDRNKFNTWQTISFTIPKDGVLLNINKIIIANGTRTEQQAGFFLDDVRLVTTGETPAQVGSGVDKEYVEANFVKKSGDKMSGELEVPSLKSEDDVTVNLRTLGGGDYRNTVFGLGAGWLNSGLNYITAIGYSTMQENTSGIYGTAVGASTMYGNTTANFNTAMGGFSLNKNMTGHSNVSFGYAALQEDYFSSNQAAFGVRALKYIQNGYNNTAIGYQAGLRNETTGGYLTSASSSLFLGADTQAKDNNGYNEIVIGTGTKGNGSNTATIGNEGTQAVYLKGVAKADPAQADDDLVRRDQLVAQNRTGTILDLGRIAVDTYNYDDPLDVTEYTIEINRIVNGCVSVFVNGPTEPTVQSATKVKGSDFIPNTTMEMVVRTPNGVAIEYYFIER